MDAVHDERIIADRLGLARETVRKARLASLTAGVDYSDSYPVCYTGEGVLKLLKALKLKIPKERARHAASPTIRTLIEQSIVHVPGTSQATIWRPEDRDMVITRCAGSRGGGGGHWKNPGVVEAKMVDDEPAFRTQKYRGEVPDRFRVRVAASAHWTPGMLLKGCKHIQRDLWEFLGRPPRGRRDQVFTQRGKGS